jgi:hypothetical protein
VYRQLRRTWAGAAGAVAAILLGLTVVTSPASAQTPPYQGGELPPQGGAALLVTSMDVTATDLAGSLGAAGCTPRLIAITEAGAWLLYVPGAPDLVNADFPSPLVSGTPFAVMCDAQPTAQDAVAVIEQYFADIDAENYQEAYAAWEPGANPLSYEDFVAGYADTASVSVDIGEPGPIGAGAGQRYIEIPVVIHATLDDASQQTFEGTFTLHRVAEVPGSTPEQQQWHIQSADLVETS